MSLTTEPNYAAAARGLARQFQAFGEECAARRQTILDHVESWPRQAAKEFQRCLKSSPRCSGEHRIKYAGITEAASRLGVHRIHLYLVLEGKRQSRSLLVRYQDLKRKERKS